MNTAKVVFSQHGAEERGSCKFLQGLEQLWVERQLIQGWTSFHMGGDFQLLHKKGVPVMLSP